MTTDQAGAALRLRRELRARLRQGAQELSLTAADAALLLDELGRLQQGNERLRRQNRRVRQRLQRAGLDAGAGGDGDHIVVDDDGRPLDDDAGDQPADAP